MGDGRLSLAGGAEIHGKPQICPSFVEIAPTSSGGFRLFLSAVCSHTPLVTVQTPMSARVRTESFVLFNPMMLTIVTV